MLQTIQRGYILDVGCGGGNNCQYINNKDEFNAYGIDFSEGMIKQARKRYQNIKVEKMDMCNLSFQNQTFDGILSNKSLIHIPTELVSHVLKEFKRVLKYNGKLLLIVSDGSGEEIVEEPYREGQNIYVYVKHYTVDEISLVLKENGFKVDTVEKMKTISENGYTTGKIIIFATKES